MQTLYYEHVILFLTFFQYIIGHKFKADEDTAKANECSSQETHAHQKRHKPTRHK